MLFKNSGIDITAILVKINGFLRIRGLEAKIENRSCRTLAITLYYREL